MSFKFFSRNSSLNRITNGVNKGLRVGGQSFSPGDGYTYHVFTTTGTSNFLNNDIVKYAPSKNRFISTQDNASVSADIFLVAGGGGGGGSNRGAAAGAGGLIYRPGMPLSSGPFSITIGAGGAAGPQNNSNGNVYGAMGGDSTFGSSPQPQYLIAKGGGNGGAGDFTGSGNPGGSGGSEWYPGYPANPGTQPSQPGDSGTYGFGNPSGASSGSPVYSGGGGGAGAAGRPANDGTYAGGGGAGKTYPQFNSTNLPGTPFSPKNGNFAGGGTAADYQGGYRANPESFPFGGGGGNNGPGFTPGSDPTVNGFVNTGGGGGSGGNGGPGVCIVRYAVNQLSKNIRTFGFTGSQQTLTIPSTDGYTRATILAWGAGGGGGYTGGSGAGGGGGYSEATISVSPGNSFAVVVGGGGDTRGPSAGAGSPAYGGGGLAGPAGFGGNGGGFSGVFYDTPTVSFSAPSQPRAIIIAGGGGGGGWEVSGFAGGGGGTTGGNGQPGSSGTATGGTQSAGGTGAQSTNGNGGALFGGTEPGTDGGGSGGGGAGYYGGGAGGNVGNGEPGAGGSGYVGGHPLYTTSLTRTTQATSSTVANTTSPYYVPGYGNGGASGANQGQPGYIVVLLS